MLMNMRGTGRALDYYDKIDLIKPSTKTSWDHRLYTENDIMRIEHAFIAKYEGELNE
jgi:DNA-binding transcriptional MerR regulator